jgi:hypothetical protein
MQKSILLEVQNSTYFVEILQIMLDYVRFIKATCEYATYFFIIWSNQENFFFEQKGLKALWKHVIYSALWIGFNKFRNKIMFKNFKNFI